VFFINYLLGGNVIPTDIGTLLLSAFVMTVWSVLMMWIGELITEKWISNGISLLIFASIVAGITQQIYWSVAGTESIMGVIIFMFVIISKY
jgi:preprotein translocase subunit SecY